MKRESMAETTACMPACALPSAGIAARSRNLMFPCPSTRPTATLVPPISTPMKSLSWIVLPVVTRYLPSSRCRSCGMDRFRPAKSVVHNIEIAKQGQDKGVVDSNAIGQRAFEDGDNGSPHDCHDEHTRAI